MINFEDQFAKDCANNYEKRVEFSVRLSWGPLSQIHNFPRGIPELDKATNKRKREIFKSILYGFYERIGAVASKTSKHDLHIQYLPLQSRDYEHAITTYDKQQE
jgi:hypothetical protein